VLGKHRLKSQQAACLSGRLAPAVMACGLGTVGGLGNKGGLLGPRPATLEGWLIKKQVLGKRK